MFRTFPVSLALALLVAAPLFAEDSKVKRDRDAAAALALQLEMQRAKKAVVPVESLHVYADGLKLAVEKRQPLIAYPSSVKSPVCPKGSVCATGNSNDPLIVFAYPHGNGVVVSESLPPTATEVEILQAFRRAVAKAKGEESPKESERDPFFIDLTLGLLISAPPACPGGVCPAPVAVPQAAKPPMPMVGPGPVTTAERQRPIQRARGIVAKILFPWRR